MEEEEEDKEAQVVNEAQQVISIEDDQKLLPDLSFDNDPLRTFSNRHKDKRSRNAAKRTESRLSALLTPRQTSNRNT